MKTLLGWVRTLVAGGVVLGLGAATVLILSSTLAGCAPGYEETAIEPYKGGGGQPAAFVELPPASPVEGEIFQVGEKVFLFSDPDMGDPVWAPDGKSILFWKDLHKATAKVPDPSGGPKSLMAYGIGELWKYSLDSRSFSRLVADNAHDPQWSSDASRIFFFSYDTSGLTITIKSVAPDGSGVQEITKADPRRFWLLNNGDLVFARQNKVYRRSADSMEREWPGATLDPKSSVSYFWPATDGSAIVVWRGQRLFLYDSSGQLLVEQYYGGDARGNIHWSPDSKKLLILKPFGAAYLTVVDMPQRNVRAILAATDREDFLGGIWSPDGRYLLFTRALHRGGVPPALWVITADGSNMQMLAANVVRADWSPTESEILFHESGRARIVNLLRIR